MTFKKIVYPAGFEEDGSDPAFAMAAKLARESRGVLYLIHVLPLPTPMTFPAEGVLLADRDRAEAMLQKLALKVPVGVERKLIIKFGHTASEIAKTDEPPAERLASKIPTEVKAALDNATELELVSLMQ